jgi:hypothetical protein
MELHLNIYEKREVVKTYTAETYDITFGTVEDLIETLDLDALQSGDDAAIIKVASKVVMKSMNIIKPLLKDIFDGLTDEELRKTKVVELAKVLIKVVKFSMAEIAEGATEKN